MSKLSSSKLYIIAWIASRSSDRAIATALLDERHDAPEGFDQNPSDTNAYTWGRIGKHNVIIISLYVGLYGPSSVRRVASNLIASLPHIKVGLLLGIGGGVAEPSGNQDIRLGDVVVSQPNGTTGGVDHYGLNSEMASEKQGSLNMLDQVLLSALEKLQAEYTTAPPKIPHILQHVWGTNPRMTQKKNDFTYPGISNDRLFESSYGHVSGSTCNNCDESFEIERLEQDTNHPKIHYGAIASSSILPKNARNEFSIITGKQYLCVEKEAVGLPNPFPCLVIKGICDYADLYKNDRWNYYASAVAGAFVVDLLRFVSAA